MIYPDSAVNLPYKKIVRSQKVFLLLTSVIDSLDRDVLKWLGNVKRMCGERLTERLYKSDTEVVETGLS